MKPDLEKDIKQYRMREEIMERDPHAFDRVNLVSPSELRNILHRSDYVFDPAYTIDKNGNMRIHEISIMRNPYKDD